MVLTIYVVLSGMIMGIAIAVSMSMAWKLYTDKRWAVRVPVAIQRGNSIVWDLHERARHVTRKDGSEALVLRKRRKTTLKPPKYSRVSVNEKGKPVYPILNTIAGQFFPLKLNSKVSFEAIEDKSSKNWAISEIKRLNDVYRPSESWLAKYGVFIMNATFAAMVIFFTIYFSGKIEISSNALAGGATRMAEAMEKMAAASGSMPAP